MDHSVEDAHHNFDLPHRKRHPAPIVSLGRIIGYRLAGLGFTIKAMDVFKTGNLRNLVSKPEERRLGKSSNKKPKRSVSFSDIVQETILEEEIGGKHDTNVNATQGKGSDTNVRKTGTKRRPTPTLHQNSTVTKSSHRAAFKGKLKASTSASSLKSACIKVKPDTQKEKNEIDSTKNQVNKTQTRSSTSLFDASLTVNASKSPSKSSSKASFVVATSASSKKKRLRNRIAKKHKGDVSRTLDGKFQSKSTENVFYSSQSRKTKHLELAMRKRTPRFNSIKSQDSSSKRCLMTPEKKAKKSIPKHIVTHKSPMKIACKRPLGRRRWADVVAGTSQIENNVTDFQNRTLPKNSAKQETNKTKRVESSVETPEPSKLDTCQMQDERRRSIRLKAINDKTDAGGSGTQKRSSDQITLPPPTPVGNSDYQDNFPSLEEQKGKSLKRKKWYQQQKAENPDNNTITSKRIGKNRRGIGGTPLIPRSKTQERKKRNKKAKHQKDSTDILNKTDGHGTLVTSDKCDGPQNESWYIIDNMQEVVIQPVGKVCALREQMATGHMPHNGESSSNFTIISVGPHQETNSDNTRSDICHQLDAMSVDGSLECTSSANPEMKKKTKEDLSNDAKSLTAQKDVSKSKLDAPGPSQKKVSAKYRSLLRRDYGKVGAKTATQMFNCGRWVDMHQREKIHDRFESHQERREQTTKTTDTPCEENTDDHTEGTSQSQTSLPCNRVYYCVPQDNNGCPTM